MGSLDLLIWANPSSRNRALRSTQSLTELNNRNLRGGKGCLLVRLTTSLPAVSRLSKKSEGLDVSETYGHTRYVQEHKCKHSGRRIPSSGMLHRVALVRTDVSEELSATFIRVTKIDELGTTQAATSNRRTLRQVPPKRRFLQEPHGVTTQKTPFCIVTAVKTSNLTMNQRRSQRINTGLVISHTNRSITNTTVQPVSLLC
jgi:hypothetical protein